MRVYYILLVVGATLLGGSKAATTSDHTQASVMTSAQGMESWNAAQTNGINQRFLRSSKASNSYNEEAEERVATSGDIAKLKAVLGVKSTKTIDAELVKKKNELFTDMLRSESLKKDIFSNHLSEKERPVLQTLLVAFRWRKSVKFDTNEKEKAIRSRPKTS